MHTTAYNFDKNISFHETPSISAIWNTIYLSYDRRFGSDIATDKNFQL